MAHPEIPVTLIDSPENRRPERVDWKYGIRLVQPIDPWFRPIHSCDDNSVDIVIPSRNELREFFKFLRTTAGKTKKPLGFQRDYAMFLLNYSIGIRLNECRMLDVDDINFERGTVHVCYGKGTNGSGRRERWVPLTLNSIDEVIKVYLKHYRPHFLNADRNPALFLSEHGYRISGSTIKRRLQDNIEAAIQNNIAIKYFTCHDLRRAFATHFYEDYPHKIEVVRHMLGHSLLATTQRYLRPRSLSEN